jgi:hypothetical protein
VVSLEQRVERVEVHVDAHQKLLMDLRTGLQHFQARVDARFGQFEARVDARFAQVDARFAQIDGRFLVLDQKVDAVRHDMALQFRWLVGLMLTGMATIAAAILAG